MVIIGVGFLCLIGRWLTYSDVFVVLGILVFYAAPFITLTGFIVGLIVYANAGGILVDRVRREQREYGRRAVSSSILLVVLALLGGFIGLMLMSWSKADVRVANRTDSEVTNVQILTGGETFQVGDIQPGGTVRSEFITQSSSVSLAWTLPDGRRVQDQVMIHCDEDSIRGGLNFGILDDGEAQGR